MSWSWPSVGSGQLAERLEHDGGIYLQETRGREPNAERSMVGAASWSLWNFKKIPGVPKLICGENKAAGRVKKRTGCEMFHDQRW